MQLLRITFHPPAPPSQALFWQLNREKKIYNVILAINTILHHALSHFPFYYFRINEYLGVIFFFFFFHFTWAFFNFFFFNIILGLFVNVIWIEYILKKLREKCHSKCDIV